MFSSKKIFAAGNNSAPPTINIIQQPTNQTANNGNATFSVSANTSNGSTPTYQWEEMAAWTQQTLPATAHWSSITYGNGMFVAVARNRNIVATSTDGINWTQRSLPRIGSWDSVTYGNGVFVAISTGGDIIDNESQEAVAATSNDGINWVERSLSPETAPWYGITYGNGLFVAVAFNSNLAYTSTDGINWTQRTLPTSAEWRSVTYGNGVFVAVAFRDFGDVPSNIAATSTDGINWTQRTLPATEYWISVTYGDGTFVAISYSSNIAATSTDGINWTQRTLPGSSSASWRCVTYGGGQFFAIIQNSNVDIFEDGRFFGLAATSTDGISWVGQSSEELASITWESVAYGNGRFVAVAQNSNIVAVGSDDALQFRPISGETANTLSLTDLTAANDGERYRAVVSAPGVQSVASREATLTVL